MAIWIILAVIAVLAIGGVSLYNGLVKLRNMKDEGWSGIDVQLKRRSDLIPNIVETVKGYAAHEKETLENVTAARAAVATAGDNPEARFKAENALTGTLKTLFAVAENYPDLKANESFLNLQGQLSDIENDLHMARRYYNGTARNLNNAVQQFPSVIIAKMFGFEKAPYFETDDDSRAAPKVQF